MLFWSKQELERIEAYGKRGAVGLIAIEPGCPESGEPPQTAAALSLWLGTIWEERKREMLLDVRVYGTDVFACIAFSAESTDARVRLREIAFWIKRALTLKPPEGWTAASQVHIGCSLLDAEAGNKEGISASVYTALKRAILETASTGLYRTEAAEEHARRLLAILQEQTIATVYQPIVSLADGSVFGYEALTRGPADSELHSPLDLFDCAEREGLLYPLDRLAREKAIAGCVGLSPQQKLFINIPASVIRDPHFTPGVTLKLLEARGLSPQHVVFEITERSSIKDFSAAKTILRHYRSQGYQIAIDDAGAGYSSLQAIAELQPDYIKIDRSLIAGVHRDKMKEHMLETFAALAEKMELRIIAEGIEQDDELYKLMQMGIHFGQGYGLARPSPQQEMIDDAIAARIRSLRRTNEPGRLPAIGTIAAPIRIFEPDMNISESRFTLP